MRAGLISVFFILWVHISFSQDRLIRMDGTEMNVRIIEVNPASVRYATLEDPSGLQMVISKEALYKIIYENGTEITFGRLDSPQGIAEVPEQNYLYHNHFTLSVSDLLFGRFTAAYENIFLQGRMGLRFTGTLGILDAGNGYYGRKLREGTLTTNWYPFGHERVTSYFGLSLSRGIFQQEDYVYNQFDPNSYHIVKVNNSYNVFSIDYGARYTTKKGFVAGAHIGIGYIFNSRESMVYFPLKAHIGYAF